MKTPEMPTFRRVDICKRQIHAMGMNKMQKSDQTLKAAVMTMYRSQLTQWPGTVGFQIFVLGVHWNVVIRKDSAKKMTLIQMKNWIR